jgi:HK97 family phage portal protein
LLPIYAYRSYLSICKKWAVKGIILASWVERVFKRGVITPEPSLEIIDLDVPMAEQRSVLASTMDSSEVFLRKLGLERLIGYVTADNTMGIATFYGFVKFISNQISSLPYNVYRFKNGITEKIVDHPLTYALETRMNKNMSPFIGRRTMLINCLVHGWSIAEIRKDILMRTETIHPYPCSEVFPMYDEISENYFFHIAKTGQVLSQDDVIFLKDISYDGKMGRSIIDWQKQTLKIDLSAKEFTEKFFENGTFMGGFITHPGMSQTTKEEVAKEMKARVMSAFSDGTGIALLPHESKYHAMGLSPSDAKLLEIFSMSDKDIAKMFNLPLSTIGDTEVQSSWGTGVEAMNTIITNSVLMPLARQIEEEVDYKCFRRDEVQGGYYTEHNFKGLLRGDFKAQSEHIINSVNNGTMTPNEGREFDNLPPLKNGGDDAYMNGTMTPISMIREVKMGNDNGKGVSASGA